MYACQLPTETVRWSGKKDSHNKMSSTFEMLKYCKILNLVNKIKSIDEEKQQIKKLENIQLKFINFFFLQLTILFDSKAWSRSKFNVTCTVLTN